MDDSPESVKPLQYSLVFTFILYYIIIYITALSWYMFSIELDMNESTTTWKPESSSLSWELDWSWLNLIDLYKDSYIGTWKIFGFEID